MSHYHPPENTGLDLVFKDDSILVVNKPAGLLSVPGRGDDKKDCMVSRVQQEYPEALTVHRLDMETSGLLLLARNQSMHRDLGRLFQERHIRKLYTAITDGIVKQAEGIINLPLISDWPNRPRQKTDREKGKPSVTLFRVLSHDHENNTTRLELQPITGRSHQLRVHMLEAGHPILGDNLYAGKSVREKANRLLLHATRLEFIHPFTKQNLLLECKIPF